MLEMLRHSIGRSIRLRRRRRWRDPLNYGLDFVSELHSRMGHLQVKTIFDVGACMGLTALEFSDAFPRAAVYAFEPVTTNFKSMRANLTGAPKVKMFQLALGDSSGKTKIGLDPVHPTTCRIGHGDWFEEIVVETLDDFCAANQVEEIDVLKIDVEGYELQVLHGAKKMLSQQAIAIIKAECAVDPDSKYHAQFNDVCNFLLPLGYRLFGIYEQYECWQKRLPALRRFDAAFVCDRLAEQRPH
jgi:FkbM family methyltransferase